MLWIIILKTSNMQRLLHARNDSGYVTSVNSVKSHFNLGCLYFYCGHFAKKEAKAWWLDGPVSGSGPGLQCTSLGCPVKGTGPDCAVPSPKLACVAGGKGTRRSSQAYRTECDNQGREPWERNRGRETGVEFCQ